MSERVHIRTGVRLTATPICQWEHTQQGGLRATWRPGCRITGGADTGAHTSAAAGPPTREQPVHALVRSGGSARRPSIDRWISHGFIAALYLLTAFSGIAIVVRA